VVAKEKEIKMFSIEFFFLVILSFAFCTQSFMRNGLSVAPLLQTKVPVNRLQIGCTNVLLSAMMLLMPIKADAKQFPICVTDSNPQTTVISCRQLGLKDDGRLLGCQANENCYSTSASSATKYSSPWKYSVQDTDQAWTLLKAAVESQGLKVSHSVMLH
jgi:hypothetical protein